MNRSQALERIHSAQAAFDVVIIGGWASGLGAALDAAARGHSVALFEQADFAKGTSSRSTKLVHGGVIYHDGQFDDSRLAINLAQGYVFTDPASTARG